MISSRPVISSGVCLAALALLAGCSSAASGGYPAGAAGAGAAPMQMQLPANPNDPNKAELRAAKAFDLGPMVVDGSGMAIYRYDQDDTNPPQSNCTGACAQKWVPVHANGDIPLVGIDRSLVGKVTRTDDDTDQVTLAGWPLYRYTGDSLPGETSGQGVANAWYPITPDGHKITMTDQEWITNEFGK